MNQMQKVNIGIVGGAGYTGGELLRVLLRHPNAHITFVHSTSSAGELVSKVHADLLGDTELKFTNTLDQNIDVLFLCVGHGDANKFLTANEIKASIKIIDLSQDFRLAASATIGDRNFIYGLPELQREAIKSANNIANPGCFATAIQLGLLPLAAKGLLKEVYTTGITGSTGAATGSAAMFSTTGGCSGIMLATIHSRFAAGSVIPSGRPFSFNLASTASFILLTPLSRSVYDLTTLEFTSAPVAQTLALSTYQLLWISAGPSISSPRSVVYDCPGLM